MTHNLSSVGRQYGYRAEIRLRYDAKSAAHSGRNRPEALSVFQANKSRRNWPFELAVPKVGRAGRSRLSSDERSGSIIDERRGSQRDGAGFRCAMHEGLFWLDMASGNGRWSTPLLLKRLLQEFTRIHTHLLTFVLLRCVFPSKPFETSVSSAVYLIGFRGSPFAARSRSRTNSYLSFDRFLFATVILGRFTTLRSDP